jgi:hypothetical protein
MVGHQVSLLWGGGPRLSLEPVWRRQEMYLWCKARRVWYDNPTDTKGEDMTAFIAGFICGLIAAVSGSFIWLSWEYEEDDE